jgi:hypothetical protein
MWISIGIASLLLIIGILLRGRFTKDLSPLSGNKKPLKDYTSSELIEILNKNEYEDPKVLACICSEILRREMTTGVLE